MRRVAITGLGVVSRVGSHAPIFLEALFAAATPALQNRETARFRRTLAGAIVTVADGQLTVEKAPARGRTAARQLLTMAGRGQPNRRKPR